MTNLLAKDLNQAFYRSLATLIHSGTKREVQGGGNDGQATLNLHPFSVEIIDPTRRTLLIPHRGNNPFATLYETLWVIEGRNDLSGLDFFLPRASSYSDQEFGYLWRAGYGPRLRYWLGHRDEDAIWSKAYNNTGRHNWDIVKAKPVDQFQYIIDTLTKNPNSRQAVMSLWDPAKECTVGQSKDYPCTNWLAFYIEDGKLDLTVGMRSNDAWFGFSGINVYEFTVMQEVLAKTLGVEVGRYYHIVNSFHMYPSTVSAGSTILDKAKRVLSTDWLNADYGNKYYVYEDENRKEYTIPYLKPFPFGKLGFYDRTQITKGIDRLSSCSDQMLPKVIRQFRNLPQMSPEQIFLMLFVLFKRLPDHRFMAYYRKYMAQLSITDLKLAVNFWIMKKRKKIKAHELHVAYDQISKNEYA